MEIIHNYLLSWHSRPMSKEIKIVSLVPSLSKTVCDLGLQDHLVGCTIFCISPKGLRHTATSVGGTKDPDLEIIRWLEPTHILVNKEENLKEHVEELQKDFNVIMTSPEKISDVVPMIHALGKGLGVMDKSAKLCEEIEFLERSLASKNSNFSYVYLIWNNPYMTVSKETYISDAMSYLGGANLIDSADRYPQISLSEVIRFNPDYLFLSSEPFPFRRRQAEDIQKKILKINPNCKIKIKWIDGQLLSWWGSMSLDFLRVAYSFDIKNINSSSKLMKDLL